MQAEFTTARKVFNEQFPQHCPQLVLPNHKQQQDTLLLKIHLTGIVNALPDCKCSHISMDYDIATFAFIKDIFLRLFTLSEEIEYILLQQICLLYSFIFFTGIWHGTIGESKSQESVELGIN